MKPVGLQLRFISSPIRMRFRGVYGLGQPMQKTSWNPPSKPKEFRHLLHIVCLMQKTLDFCIGIL